MGGDIIMSGQNLSDQTPPIFEPSRDHEKNTAQTPPKRTIIPDLTESDKLREIQKRNLMKRTKKTVLKKKMDELQERGKEINPIDLNEQAGERTEPSTDIEPTNNEPTNNGPAGSEPINSEPTNSESRKKSKKKNRKAAARKRIGK